MPTADVTASSATQVKAARRAAALPNRRFRCAVPLSNFNSRDDTGSAGTMLSTRFELIGDILAFSQLSETMLGADWRDLNNRRLDGRSA
jgi:hypothetical protein